MYAIFMEPIAGVFLAFHLFFVLVLSLSRRMLRPHILKCSTQKYRTDKYSIQLSLGFPWYSGIAHRVLANSSLPLKHTVVNKYGAVYSW